MICTHVCFFLLWFVQFHKSRIAHVPYPTMLHSELNVHISVLNGALWDMELGMRLITSHELTHWGRDKIIAISQTTF